LAKTGFGGPVKAIGYRSWELDGYQLRSVNERLHAHWQIGVNRAECRRPEFLRRPDSPRPSHRAPDPDCECGLHAWYAPNSGYARGAPGSTVHGAVAAWGRIEAHWHGFRAEYAEPMALAYSPEESPEQVDRARAIAGELGLPFVALAELEAVALEFGSRVPVDLRPSPPAYVPPYARALALAPR
jgi:hypothetical protein